MTARAFWLAEPNPDQWTNEFEFAEAYAESGHVVLLEALKNTTQTLRLMLAGNPTYPAEARAEVRKEIAEADAAIKQAERT